MQYRLSEFFWGGSLLLPTSVIFHFEYVNHVWISHILCVKSLILPVSQDFGSPANAMATYKVTQSYGPSIYYVSNFSGRGFRKLHVLLTISTGNMLIFRGSRVRGRRGLEIHMSIRNNWMVQGCKWRAERKKGYLAISFRPVKYRDYGWF